MTFERGTTHARLAACHVNFHPEAFNERVKILECGAGLVREHVNDTRGLPLLSLPPHPQSLVNAPCDRLQYACCHLHTRRHRDGQVHADARATLQVSHRTHAAGGAINYDPPG